MNTKRKFALAVTYLMATASIASAQPGTLEMTIPGNTTNLLGPSTAPVIVNMWQDDLNLTTGTTFRVSNPLLTATASFANQQYSNVYGNISTGMAFGGGNTASIGGNTQMSETNPVYNVFGAGLVQPPLNGMFVSSPTGTIVSNYQVGGRGVGIDVEATQLGHDFPSGADDVNAGIAVFTNVEPLFDANLAKDGRYYYGDLVINFSRPILNPVVHIGGLGGSYAYLPNTAGAVPQISYFSSELELQNTGVTSTFMAGNENLSVSGNKILNSSATPNAGSYFSAGSTILGFNTYGAATGSIRVNGTVTQLVYKVYVRGAAASNFNFSKNKVDISGATRDPLNGDLFYIAVSLDKPNQQIAGNIYNDKNGLTDNDVNRSGGVLNTKVNPNTSLNANLLLNGAVIATVPVTPTGSFLFNNVNVGTYTVQISTTTNTTVTLPAGWVSTGEFVGSTAGSDGTVDGKSSAIIIGLADIRTEVNFGIERVPDSKSFTYFLNPPPVLNSTLVLTGTYAPLTGSDPEDMPTEGSLVGKSIRIITVPANTQLKYNGVVVTNNTLITNYDPTKLAITFNQATVTPQTQFTYSYVDAAGIADPTPATYTLNWATGALSVTLRDFSAVNAECNANLSWTTTNELSLGKYEAQYSTDQIEFTTFNTVTPRGSTGTEEVYHASFPMKGGNVYYFRLKMVNTDGTAQYSAIRKLSCAGNTTITVAPNPVVDQFKITGMANGKNTIVIFSSEGRMMKQQTISGTTGVINVSQFAPGTYVVKIAADNGAVFTDRIIKK